MADNNNDVLEILIKLGVIGQADVKAANQLLKESGEAVKETGKAADYLDPALSNANKSMQAAGEAAHETGLHHKVLHAAIHETGAKIPALGALLRGALNPASIGLVAGIAAIEMYFKHLEEVQAKQLEWIQELQKTNDALHEITSAGKSAGEQLIDINRALAEGQVRAHGYAHDIDSMTQMWKVYTEGVKDAAAAQSTADSDAAVAMKARIDLLEKAGVISKQTADDLRAEAVYESELAKVRSEREAKEKQYQDLTNQQGGAMRKRGELGSEADAQKKLSADQAALDRNEASITKLPGIIASLSHERDEVFHRGGNSAEWQRVNTQMERMQAQLDKAKADNPEMERRVAQDRDAIAAISALDKTINDLTGQMNVLNRSIVDFEKSSQAHLDQVAQQRNMNEFGGSAANMLKLAESIAQRYQKNPVSVSQAEIGEMIRVSEAATGHAQNAKSAMGTMLAASHNLGVFGKDVERIVGVMEQMSYALPKNLTNRLAAIEAALLNQPRARGSNTGQ